MNKKTESGILEILRKISNLEVENVDVSKVKFKWHDASMIEPEMSVSDYDAFKYDVEQVGKIHTACIVYNDKLLDGRHRQKVAIELGISLPIVKLYGDYTMSELKEFVRSKHMNRNKTLAQKLVQAFRYKQSVVNVTYSMAANRYGVNEKAVKRITNLYNLLSENGYENDFESIMTKFEYGLNILPKHFEWLSKSTGSFTGALKQFKDFIDNQKSKDNLIEFDITEQEKVFNEDTGEYEIKDRVKEENVFMSKSLSLEDVMSELKRLREENLDLKKRLDSFYKMI